MVRRLIRTVLAYPLSIVFIATPVAAVEFGSVRGLQHGPIGDSPQFTSVADYEGEGAVVMRRTYGKYTVNNDPDTKVSGSALQMHVATGGGLMADKSFQLTAYLDFTIGSDADEEAKRASPASSLDTGLYRHELSVFAVYKPSPLLIGGGLGLLIVGTEAREFEFDGDKYKQDVSSAAMPVLRLFGGLTTKQFDGTLGLRLFSMGEAVVKAETPSGQKYEYDIARRNPGEVHADARFKIGNVASIAGSLAYVLTSQASEQVDEFSVKFEESGSSKERQTGGARRNDDHIRLGVGGRFDPNKMIGMLAALSYTAASYAKEEYASLEHENLGGARLDIGADVRVQQFRGYVQAAYGLESSASYTVDGNARGTTMVDETQRPPLNDGDKVKVTQGSWSLAVGGGVTL